MENRMSVFFRKLYRLAFNSHVNRQGDEMQNNMDFASYYIAYELCINTLYNYLLAKDFDEQLVKYVVKYEFANLEHINNDL